MFQLPLHLYHATPVASFLAVRCKMTHVICQFLPMTCLNRKNITALKIHHIGHIQRSNLK